MNQHPPIIVAFVADLIFSSKIALAAKGTNFKLEWIETAVSLPSSTPPPSPERLGERLHGRDGELFYKITTWQPVLLLFDLTNKGIPWEQWIPALKTSPATKRIPILAFGPHQDVALMQKAAQVGADHVLARSRFFSKMPQLFTQYAHIPDYEAFSNSCAQPLADLARQGIDLFNRGEYYRCHDALEEAWQQDESVGRDLYRGLLQTGIALYQIERGNYRGVVKMLLRVRQWLAPLPPICRSVDVALLRQNIDEIDTAVLALGPEKLEQFDWDLVQQIKTQNSNKS